MEVKTTELCDLFLDRIEKNIEYKKAHLEDKLDILNHIIDSLSSKRDEIDGILDLKRMN